MSVPVLGLYVCEAKKTVFVSNNEPFVESQGGAWTYKGPASENRLDVAMAEGLALAASKGEGWKCVGGFPVVGV